MTKELYIRKFLNKPKNRGLSCILISCEEIKSKEENPHSYLPYGQVSISDCNRTVNLEIDVETPKEYKNTIHKLKTITDSINKLVKHLEENEETLKTHWE